MQIKTQGGRPYENNTDFRRILDDSAVDALVIAAPDHWHSPAAILACQAGKHVYVEKPCSHNPHEGELLVKAARKHDRVVQHGTQRRSWPAVVEAIQRLKEGIIGPVRFARCWYLNDRGSIGHGKEAAVPDWLDWSLWQGPAPQTAYRDNVVHYNWHWFWRWGTAETGNNGIHRIDLARWGLGVAYPRRTTCGGGRYRYDDDQETPDTTLAGFDYGDSFIAWEARSCFPRRKADPAHDVAFYGDEGRLLIQGASYRVLDADGAVVEEKGSQGGDKDHLRNFADAIRGEANLNAEIAEGVASTHLCHLANMAYRTTGAVTADPKTGRVDSPEAAHELWKRAYEPGWEPAVG